MRIRCGIKKKPQTYDISTSSLEEGTAAAVEGTGAGAVGEEARAGGGQSIHTFLLSIFIYFYLFYLSFFIYFFIYFFFNGVTAAGLW
jgi:hypothetical protein